MDSNDLEKIKLAVLEERVKKLEGFMYGGLAVILLQLIGIFILWVKALMGQ